MNKLKELLEKLAVAQSELDSLLAKDDVTEEQINTKLSEISTIETKVKAQEKSDAMEAAVIAKAAADLAVATPVNQPLWA